MSWINLLNIVYPVGSIYVSTVNVSPASIVGGNWSQVQNAVLRATTNGGAGYIGSDTHTMTTDEMPSHTHPINWGWNGGEYSGGSNDWCIVLQNRSQSSGTGTTTDPNNAIAYSGNSQAFSIIQRSYNVYIWYRIS